MKPLVFLFAGALLSGCAHRGILRYPGPTDGLGQAPLPVFATPAAPEAQAPRAVARKHSSRVGRLIGAAAASFIGRSRLVVKGETYRYDCSGFMSAAYAEAGLRLTGSSAGMYDQADDAGLLHRRKLPAAGDVAFFDNTYDRNRNGRRDDKLSHVAVVESVRDDGTILLIHKGSKGIRRIHMNLKTPHDHRGPDGEIRNDYLRATNGRDGGPVLTGELWRAFGSMWALEDMKRNVSAAQSPESPESCTANSCTANSCPPDSTAAESSAADSST